jgi:hypothetical protein
LTIKILYNITIFILTTNPNRILSTMNIFARLAANKQLKALKQEAKILNDEFNSINKTLGGGLGRRKEHTEALEKHDETRLEVEKRAKQLYEKLGFEILFDANHYWVKDVNGKHLAVLSPKAFVLVIDRR